MKVKCDTPKAPKVEFGLLTPGTLFKGEVGGCKGVFLAARWYAADRSYPQFAVNIETGAEYSYNDSVRAVIDRVYPNAVVDCGE